MFPFLKNCLVARQGVANCEAITRFSGISINKTCYTKSGNVPRNIVFVEGVRTPFLKSETDYKNLKPYDLARQTLKGLRQKIEFPREMIDYIIYSTLTQHVRTSKINWTVAGCTQYTPVNIEKMTCISDNQAIITGIDFIASGIFDVVVAGGLEFMSNTYSIQHSRSLMLQASKTTFLPNKIIHLTRPGHFIPDIPAVAEFLNDETMVIYNEDCLVEFSVTRKEQDDYALRSHILAARAQQQGLLSDVVPYKVPYVDRVVDKDSIRVFTEEQLAKLKPAIIKPYGIITTGNSSVLTDGAAAALIMSEERALQLGFKPKAYLRNVTYVAQESIDQLLLGPSYAIPKILDSAKLMLKDIGVWEIHEAFAGQVCINLKAMDSDFFAQKYLKRSSKIGIPDLKKWNAWGGSLSIGDPYSATGIRLITQTANRLIKEDQQFGLVIASAAGGHGFGMIMERYPGATI